MAGAKKARSRLGRTLAPLPPAAAAALRSQIEALVAVCRQGAELESLKGLVSASPEDAVGPAPDGQFGKYPQSADSASPG